MRESTNLVSVLDLGSTKAVCLIAEPDGYGGFDVQGFGVAECKGLRRGIVSDLDETAEAIQTVIREAEQMSGAEISSLVVSIGGTHVEGINAQGFVPIYPRSRAITREDVLQVINHSRQLMIPPDREQIQALPREFRIDGQRGIRRPMGMNGSRLEVVTYIVTGQTTHIQNIEKAVGMAGKRIDQMVLQPLASGLGVLTEEEMELGTAVVDIGGGTTDVAVFSGGSIGYSATVPVAGLLVTSDVSKLLKTSPEEAERIKVEAGNASPKNIDGEEGVSVLQLGQTQYRPLQRRVLVEIIESRMRELALMVKQQIEKSGMMGMLPGGVVLTGGGSHLADADKLFAEVLKHVRVRNGAPQVDSMHDAILNQPGMATAVGLIRFAVRFSDDEFSPAEAGNWKERIRTFWSNIGGKPG
ncbi:MAG: cell division protein FtsA [Fimbriimonadaceae bacterium]|jgi:cell division protein FtsA|nr:cell division protein FtsA [Fimbriimonadaceae bacterium]